MIDKKYLDPETNPAIPSEEEPTDKENQGLPLVFKPKKKESKSEKDDVKDLPTQIKEAFPSQPLVAIDEEISLIIKDEKEGGNVLIGKLKDKDDNAGGWHYTELKDASPEDIQIIDEFIKDQKERKHVDPQTNPIIPDYSE